MSRSKELYNSHSIWAVAGTTALQMRLLYEKARQMGLVVTANFPGLRFVGCADPFLACARDLLALNTVSLYEDT